MLFLTNFLLLNEASILLGVELILQLARLHAEEVHLSGVTAADQVLK